MRCRPASVVLIVGDLDDDDALRDFLSRADQPYRVPGAGQSADVLALHGLDGARLPVAIIDDEEILVRPSMEQLGDALGVRRPPRETDYDVVVIGAGPAGLAAAVYAACDGLSVVVAERSLPGGEAGCTTRIDDYFAIDPAGPPMTGARLSRIGVSQAEVFGAELVTLRPVVEVRGLDDGRQELELSTGEHVRGRAVVIATGRPGAHQAVGQRLVTDGADYLVTGHDLLDHGGWSLERPPLPLEASVPGVFAAGDIRHGSVKRVAGAVREGAAAIGLIDRYLGMNAD